MELAVVSGRARQVEPNVVMVPLKAAAGADRRKEVRVTVENNTKGAATASVGLTVPAGWKVLPAAAPVSLGAEGETTTIRFTVTPPLTPPAGQVPPKDAATHPQGARLIGTQHLTPGYQ